MFSSPPPAWSPHKNPNQEATRTDEPLAATASPPSESGGRGRAWGGRRIVVNYASSASTRGGDHYVHSGLGETGAQSDTRGPRRAPASSSRGRRGRHHASMFRNRGSSSRTIDLNYSDGSIAAIRQQGLNTITHIAVFKALEQLATRYRMRGRLAEANTRTQNWGLDETGTIDTSGLL